MVLLSHLIISIQGIVHILRHTNHPRPVVTTVTCLVLDDGSRRALPKEETTPKKFISFPEPSDFTLPPTLTTQKCGVSTHTVPRLLVPVKDRLQGGP